MDRLFTIDLRLLQGTGAVVLHPVICGSWAGPALKPNTANCEGCRAAVRGKLAKSLLCLLSSESAAGCPHAALCQILQSIK